ncbi:MAG: PepSY-associated TM helix domain-containing protein [Bacteroidota bacterium]
MRSLHRDLGYIYVGLIISFALSGIFMNHREHWHPEKYTITAKEITTTLPSKNDITDDFVKQLVKGEFKINDKVKRHNIRKNELKIACENYDIEINIETGKGEIVEFRKTPFISQIMGLHKSTSNWWIYYSDVFALSLITIAITGMLIIPKGKFSFKSRGWKLAIAGLVFPIIFLILFS